MHLERCAITLCLVAALGGCADEPAVAPPLPSGGGSTGAGAGGAAGAGGGALPDPTPISAKATVKLKTKERLVGDLSQVLSLPPDALCKEVGVFACDEVHSIALGGVDAYGAGIYEPLKASAVTTPIAVDRLVLAACQTRARIDFADPPNATLFVGLPLDQGKLSDVEHAAVGDVITALYRRGHLRDPKPSELAHLRQLYLDIELRGRPQPARDWATLGCYAVLTMLESVFY